MVEVYGLVTAKNDQGRYEYIPFVNIAVNETQRGTYANYEGMFSIVIKKGQSITFSALGFKPRTIKIDDEVKGMYKSLTVELEPTPIKMEEVTVSLGQIEII